MRSDGRRRSFRFGIGRPHEPVQGQGVVEGDQVVHGLRPDQEGLVVPAHVGCRAARADGARDGQVGRLERDEVDAAVAGGAVADVRNAVAVPVGAGVAEAVDGVRGARDEVGRIVLGDRAENDAHQGLLSLERDCRRAETGVAPRVGSVRHAVHHSAEHGVGVDEADAAAREGQATGRRRVGPGKAEEGLRRRRGHQVVRAAGDVRRVRGERSEIRPPRAVRVEGDDRLPRKLVLERREGLEHHVLGIGVGVRARIELGDHHDVKGSVGPLDHRDEDQRDQGRRSHP